MSSDNTIQLNQEENLKNKFCSKPFDSIEYHLKGKCFVCCPSWLDKPIGNLNDQSIDEIWNSPSAQELRESIIDGSYRFCKKDVCPDILSNNLKKIQDLTPEVRTAIENKQTKLEQLPESIMLVYDMSCNLSCPSCRVQKVSHSPGTPEFNETIKFTDQIAAKHINSLGNNRLILNITGSGDPFASTAFRQFIESIPGHEHPQLKLIFQTNGVLLTPSMWNKISNVHSNIHHIFVSIDAATEETYLKVRRGGHWKILNDNMVYLAKLRKEYRYDLLQVNFIVQKTNYKEMADFASKYLALGVDSVSFSLIQDWGTWDAEGFKDQCVYREDHPLFNDFLDELAKPVMGEPRIYLGNLTLLRQQALKKKFDELSAFQKQCFYLKQRLSHLKYTLVRKKFYLSKPIIEILKKVKKRLSLSLR